MRRFFGDTLSGKKEKVVSMDRFRSGRSLSPLRQAEAYWSALRIDENAPLRSAIDPRGLENILPYAFILERIAPGVARFRLAGQHLTELTGMEVRGMPLTALFTGAARAEVSAVLEHMFDTPAVAELDLSAERRFSLSPLEARMILLPLKSDFGDTSRALGVVVAEGEAGKRATHSFDVTRSHLRDLNGELTIPPAVTKNIPGFAEESAAFDAAPHLKLIVSRD
ncbi:PAS domain-containing protein [Tropicibacter sp. Alg240-R139]|uniref:PAS domain-containing protein n=1 Tax=Tropicibacter sp. Alg240-R139 TaxID=2305991 RepID=UPI0013DEE589|nr:PAS domain-containing protein [Tropicibacter sp. Alg240-R139]